MNSIGVNLPDQPSVTVFVTLAPVGFQKRGPSPGNAIRYRAPQLTANQL